MSKVEIELNDEGIRELLKSPGIQSKLQETANTYNLLYDGVKLYATRAVVKDNRHTKKDKEQK